MLSYAGEEMYANAPHASVAPPVPQTSAVNPPPAYTPPGHVPHDGQHPPAAAYPQAYAHASTGPAAPVAHTSPPQRALANVTGAYQPSGDAAIDRMIAFEAACKRFGSLM